MVENPVLSGPIMMEGMQCFASKIRNFCVQILKGWMDGKTLTNTKLSSFELLSIFDLASCFFIPNIVFASKSLVTKFLDLG